MALALPQQVPPAPPQPLRLPLTLELAVAEEVGEAVARPVALVALDLPGLRVKSLCIGRSSGKGARSGPVCWRH